MKSQIAMWQGITAVAIIAGIAGGWFTLHYATARQAADAGSASAKDTAEDTADKTERVTLSAAKRQVANIRVQPVTMRELSETRVVPGRVQYDDRRYVKVRAVTAGIMVDVRVKPGDQVTKDQALAVISSPELGEVRADVLKRHAEWALAQRKQQWESQVESNLRPFVTAIQKRVDINELQKQFQSTTLGEFREKLVSAYTRLQLAESLLKNADPVAAPGLLAARTVQERTAERQAAEAALLAACEQALFDAEQRRDSVAMNAMDAHRRSNISRQHVRTLLGYDPGDENVTPSSEIDLSRAEVRAPFAGTIEQRNCSNSGRVQPNDELFVVADTSTLWIVVDVREQDWAAVSVQPGQPIGVRVPAIPDRPFTATVHFVGREVSIASNAISIVAEIDNSDAMLRPGLFVQATLAIGHATARLVVPTASVVIQDQQVFVFVQESEDTFRRVAVTCGLRTDDWIEIRTGLNVGDPVVVQGAFVLKSELLLEPEE